MLENITEIKSGSILIDADGEVLYSSFTCRYETFRFLEEIRALYKIRNGVFGAETYGNYRVVLQKVIDKNYTIYLIEFKDANSNYDNMPELKAIINKTREKLNKLIAIEQNHLNDEVLELSRNLDILIHYYITLEMNLKS
jgi:hypothetical protein